MNAPQGAPRRLLPSDTTLPFFSYGIFQSGEIAYPQIEPFVSAALDGTVGGELLERDGLPILSLGDYGRAGGDLLLFSDRASEAYDVIADLEPHRIYKWETVPVDTASGEVLANVLSGRHPDDGTSHPERPYRSRDDVLFTAALDEVKSVLDSVEHGIRDLGVHDARDFFRLQMAYMLLFSAIERYCAFRYGFSKAVTAKVKLLAEEESFATAFGATVRREDEVRRSDDPDEREVLDPSQPAKALGYYYAIRSNITHRGKGVERDKERVRAALSEMLTIFTAVLDETLGARRD